MDLHITIYWTYVLITYEDKLFADEKLVQHTC